MVGTTVVIKCLICNLVDSTSHCGCLIICKCDRLVIPSDVVDKTLSLVSCKYLLLY